MSVTTSGGQSIFAPEDLKGKQECRGRSPLPGSGGPQFFHPQSPSWMQSQFWHVLTSLYAMSV